MDFSHYTEVSLPSSALIELVLGGPGLEEIYQYFNTD